MIYRRINYIFIFSLMFLVAACGGGGGGGSTNSQSTNDTTPNTFAFLDEDDALPGVLVESQSITVSGINAASTIGISGSAEYSINNGEYRATPGSITNGQTVRVRLTSSSEFNAAVEATLTIGGVSDTFVVTTMAEDTTPNTPVFNSVENADLDGVVESNTITITGINNVVTISVQGGEFSINGGDYQSQGTSIEEGDTLTLRLTSASAFETTETMTIIIGSIQALFSVTTKAENPPPSASIHFPPKISTTDAENITVRGNANSSSGVMSVVVNGVNAISDDNFATWMAIVPLSVGENNITVAVTDSNDNNNSAAASAVVKREHAYFYQPSKILLDEANDQLFVADYGTNQIIRVDLNTGVRSVFSDNTTANALNSNLSVGEMALDKDNNRILLVDANFKRVIDVDLDTGVRGIFREDTNLLPSPEAIAIDEANNRALVVNSGPYKSVTAVNLTTGALSEFFSTNDTGEDQFLGNLIDIEVDSAKNAALIFDFTYNKVWQVDLTTKEVSVHAYISHSARGVLFEVLDDQVISYDSDAVISEPWNGAGNSIVSNNGIPGTDNPLLQVSDIVWDGERNQLVVPDLKNKAIYSIDIVTGERTVLSGNNTIPSTTNPLIRPSYIAVDAQGETATVFENETESIMVIDLNSGERTILSSATAPNDINIFSAVSGMAADPENLRILVTDNQLDAVIAVDVLSGERSILSDNSSPDTNLAFNFPDDILVDAGRNQAFIVDRWEDSIFAVDLTTGERSLASGPLDHLVIPLDDPRGIAINESADKLYVLDDNLNAVVEIEIDTGIRTIVSNGTDPDMLPFENVSGITLVDNDRKLLAVEYDAKQLIEVNLQTGERSVFSDEATSALDAFIGPVSLAKDQKDVIYLTSTEIAGIIAIDYQTKERVYVSR